MIIDKETLIKLASAQVTTEVKQLYAFREFHKKVKDAIWKRLDKKDMISYSDLMKFFEDCERWAGLIE